MTSNRARPGDSDQWPTLKRLYLRCHVVRRAAESVGDPVEVNLQFAHTKIRQTNVTLMIKKHVVKFQISEEKQNVLQIQSETFLGIKTFCKAFAIFSETFSNMISTLTKQAWKR